MGNGNGESGIPDVGLALPLPPGLITYQYKAGPVSPCGFPGIYLLLSKSAPSESTTGPVCVCVVRIEGEGPM
jgi:hypothetical protein